MAPITTAAATNEAFEAKHPGILRGLKLVRGGLDRASMEAIADSKSVGQKIRFSRHRARLQTARVRKEANDYHEIRDMIPASNPHRDDIVARISATTLRY